MRTLADAERYVLNGPIASYEKFGFGMYVVELRESGTPIGLCRFVKRDWLPDVDLGFAFLPQYRSQGYAHESASAVRRYGHEVLGLMRIVAIVLRRMPIRSAFSRRSACDSKAWFGRSMKTPTSSCSPPRSDTSVLEGESP